MPHFKTDQINSSAHPPSFSAPHHESHPPGADSQSKMVNADHGLHNYHARSVHHNLHSSNGTGVGRCYKLRYRFRESRHILCGAAVFSENSGRCAGRFHKYFASCSRRSLLHKLPVHRPPRRGVPSYHVLRQSGSFLFPEKAALLLAHFALRENSSVPSDRGQ